MRGSRRRPQRPARRGAGPLRARAGQLAALALLVLVPAERHAAVRVCGWRRGRGGGAPTEPPRTTRRRCVPGPPAGGPRGCWPLPAAAFRRKGAAPCADYIQARGGRSYGFAAAARMPEWRPGHPQNSAPGAARLHRMLVAREGEDHALVLLDRDAGDHGPCAPDQAFLHMVCTDVAGCERSFLRGDPPGQEVHRYSWEQMPLSYAGHLKSGMCVTADKGMELEGHFPPFRVRGRGTWTLPNYRWLLHKSLGPPGGRRGQGGAPGSLAEGWRGRGGAPTLLARRPGHRPWLVSRGGPAPPRPARACGPAPPRPASACGLPHLLGRPGPGYAAAARGACTGPHG